MTAPKSNANLIGSMWMVFAMLGFAFEDSFLKAASEFLPVSMILVMFGIGGAIVFALVARLQGDRIFTKDAISRPMRWRVLFETIGRLFFILALALAPLSSATVILQTTPIIVVGGAALFLGESVGWRRWTAIAIGLIGVMVIVQPWSAEFSPLTILAVIGMLGFAARDLASRAAPASLSPAVLGFYGFVTIILAGVLFYQYDSTPYVMPNSIALFYMTGAIFAGVIAYASLMKAMRTGEIAAVAPFRYSRLLIGIAIGVVWFKEEITNDMIIGSALIVSAGLFLLWRGRES